MAVMIALGNDKDLGFIDFQLFPGLEGTDPGSLKHHDYVATILHQVSLQQAIASARIQLCAVAIFTLTSRVCYFVLFYLRQASGSPMDGRTLSVARWHIVDESCIDFRHVRVVLER